MIRLVLLLALALPIDSEADWMSNNSLGVGLGTGTSANGLSAKYIVSRRVSVQANLGSIGGTGTEKFTGLSGVGFSTDLLFHTMNIIHGGFLHLDISAGFGLGIGLADSQSVLAGAGVVGLELNIQEFPFDFVVEYRPSLLVTPDVELELVDLSFHLRFYFGV